MKKHQWKDDICIKCGVKRKASALTKNLMRSAYPNNYFHDYYINNEWITKRPNCI